MKQYLLFNLFLIQSFLGFAQAPNKMSYQAIVRNSNNVVVSNHAVGMRISILQGTATGTSVYTETQSPSTNANGLIAIEIGTGTIVSGSFSNIDWSNGPYFVKTETDPNGGTNYTLTGTSQLLSVPYALHSKTADISNNSKKSDTSKVALNAVSALNGLPSGGQNRQSITICDGTPTWTFNGQCPAKIDGFICADTVHTGTLYNTNVASGMNSSITYAGGNGGVYAAQSIASTGVTGLTASLAAGTLNNGNGTLTLTISGTPASAGIASFNITIGNKSCQFQRVVNVLPVQPNWANGTVFCNGSPTLVIDVTNPVTGKTWMDRNLGANQAATSSTDTLAYGDLYQWGRGADGHQCRNSGTTSTLSSTDQPGHTSFVFIDNSPSDWRSPQNDNLWQGVNGLNNPCPSGYRIPTNVELDAERTSWSQNNEMGAINSSIKLPMSGYRYDNGGSISHNGSYGVYWSINTDSYRSWYLFFSNSDAYMNSNPRAYAFPIRCIKNYPASVSSLDTIGSINNGNLYEGIAASNISTTINYTIGNGAMYEAQTITSTGVSGLTATLATGSLNNGNGTLTLTISGTPNSAGVAKFNISIGNKICQLQRVVNVLPVQPNWSNGTVFCNGAPTLVIDVTNPITGKTWMDRNLGASQAATSSTDAAAYGDLYQWGRKADGHQCRNSGTTSTLSTTDQPNHANFILSPNSPSDWLDTKNDNLWQGVNGTNNPCPNGYRLPTYYELESERMSWSQNNNTGAFISPLKLPMSSYRNITDGSVNGVGGGAYWSITVNGSGAWSLGFNSWASFMSSNLRAEGFTVRCIKDYPASVGSIDTIGSINIGNLYTGMAENNANTTINYTNGNGAYYATQTFTSTGVNGLTAKLAAGTLNSGNGTLKLTIFGTPNSTGIASFYITIGNKSCIVQKTIVSPTGPNGTVFCNGIPTAILNVTNPVTGKIWMDRNLGASQAATSSTDAAAYGDLYQWGRKADGHQCRNSGTTSTLSTTDQPNHASFILRSTTSSFGDWRSSSSQNNNLWQGVNGVNNPCPSGYRLPSSIELNLERTSWSQNNSTGAFNSVLKLPMSGMRNSIDGSIFDIDSVGAYWSNEMGGTISTLLSFSSSEAYMRFLYMSSGHSVRCIKD